MIDLQEHRCRKEEVLDPYLISLGFNSTPGSPNYFMSPRPDDSLDFFFVEVLWQKKLYYINSIINKIKSFE